MKSARKLPCGHVFHEFCLRRWLEQDSSCAVCRQSLDLVDANQGRLQPDARQDNPLNDEVVNTLQQFIDTLSPYNNRFSRWWTRFLFESMNEGQVY
jgi:autocrine motility factor receptor